MHAVNQGVYTVAGTQDKILTVYTEYILLSGPTALKQ